MRKRSRHGRGRWLPPTVGSTWSSTWPESLREASSSACFHRSSIGCGAFLPLLRKAKDARLVNVASLFGLIAPYGQSAYCASKFAVRGFSDVLRHELEDTGIRVCTVMPGGVRTAIARSASAPPGISAEEAAAVTERAEKALRMPPEKAARIILRGVGRGKARILVGLDARIASLIERVFPVGYWRILKSQLDLYRNAT